VIGAFLVIAIVMWWRVWVTGHPSSTITCQCGDVSEALGYLAWAPWAVTHGHNPFLSNAIYAGQGGANMLVNATWMAFALLFAPITWLFGPVLTFNVVVTLAPVVSGWCCFLAVRKITSFVPGQVVAAALYGFSPLIVASDPYGHFFQIWMIFPPLLFLCLYDLFVTQRHRPVSLGLVLGLLVIVQFFTSTEVLTVSAITGVIGVAAAAVVAPRTAWARRRSIVTGLAVAAGTAAVILAYPVWFAIDGPRHIVGYAWSGTPYAGNAPSAVINAGPNIRMPSAGTELGGYFGNVGPNGAYLGIPLLVFLAISAVVWVRNRLAWVLVAVGVSSYLLAIGLRNTWTPWRLFSHVPLANDIIPGRISVITVLAAALLLALSADGWWALASRRTKRGHHDGRRPNGVPLLGLLGAFLALITAATILPIATAYSFPYVIKGTSMPAWFRDVAPRLPEGTEVLAYPYPEGVASEAMGWQAIDGLHFRIAGGFAIVPGADGRHSSALSPFGGSIATLDALSLNIWGALPAATTSLVQAVRASLQHWGVQVVVVPHRGRDPNYAAGYFTAVLGRLPRLQDGALVWYGLGHSEPLSLGPNVLADCVPNSPTYVGLAVSECVLKASRVHT